MEDDEGIILCGTCLDDGYSCDFIAVCSFEVFPRKINYPLNRYESSFHDFLLFINKSIVNLILSKYIQLFNQRAPDLKYIKT